MNPVATTTWQALLQSATEHARHARFDDCLALCRQIMDQHDGDPSDTINSALDALLGTGSLLQNFGFLSLAEECYTRAAGLAPNDARATANLANVAREAGRHAQSCQLYAELLQKLPNHPVIRRNALVSLEYDSEVADPQRLTYAKTWGEWAIARTGTVPQRQALTALENRPLRIGYVSADFCQHTVGLFIKDVLATHDHNRVMPFVYSAGSVSDGVTAKITAACTFRDVARLDDAALDQLIRQDEIDVLIDLSGHTGGSRLTVFALRPAPVQVSWLGYFATTGLPVMDAVLLDEWHTPPEMQAQFVEPIVRLAGGRFCYTPMTFAPAVAPLPSVNNEYVTFGCFNNTAKLNARVYAAWARILAAVPSSRLVLKWRTFQDATFCESVRQAFRALGIDPQRLSLRGPSFHEDALAEYADIDIALDPFPFTGGITSCEALWQGVPVVTWPQSRVVSRQTFAFLSAIGLPELAGQNENDYVRIAVELASDQPRLLALRTGLRDRMHASPLMDLHHFTATLECCLIDLYRTIDVREKARMTNQSIPKTVLHVGPGHRSNGASLPAALRTPQWREIRLDIDPANEPDIVGSMLDLSAVADASMDALYSSHNIEHVYAFEVPVVLKEFLRVLKPEGFLVVTCPDLQAVCALVAQDKLTEPAYQSPAGPISPLDILYGHGAALAAGHHYMAHKGGFTLNSLVQALQAAGFQMCAGKRREAGLDLWVVATKELTEESNLRTLAGEVLPAS